MSIARLIPVLLCSAALVGCEGASEPEFNVPDTELDDLQAGKIQNENPLLGSWRLKSAVMDDEEVDLPPGFSLFVTFRADRDYAMAANNTENNFVCRGEETSCTIYGQYEYTNTTLTFIELNGPDNLEPETTTGSYEIYRGRLIYIPDDDEVEFTFKRTGRDCWVRVCS